MAALAIGIVFVLSALYAVLPVSWSLRWWPEVVDFVKGALPVIALIIGLIAIFIGIVDIKDRMEAKREETKKRAKKQ